MVSQYSQVYKKNKTGEKADISAHNRAAFLVLLIWLFKNKMPTAKRKVYIFSLFNRGTSAWAYLELFSGPRVQSLDQKWGWA